jgi:hypothetical protein
MNRRDAMNEERLVTYLKDHLAGAVLGMELIEACREHNRDTPLATFLSGLLAEVGEDRKVLEDLISRFDAKPSAGKMASAWLAEKGMRFKTEGLGYDALSRMEELEVLLLGIRGKLALWDVLGEIRSADDRLRQVGFPELRERAKRQMEEVEARRVEAARQAFLN